MTKVKKTDYCRQSATKGCHRQTAETQAGTSKGKLTNMKLLAPSLTSQYPKQKVARRQSPQISPWAEM